MFVPVFRHDDDIIKVSPGFGEAPEDEVQEPLEIRRAGGDPHRAPQVLEEAAAGDGEGRGSGGSLRV